MRKFEPLDWYLVGAIALAMVFANCAFSPKARAQEHHAPFHDFYKEWKQPSNGYSCCAARFNERGEEVGDCEESHFELRSDKNGNLDWWAFVKKANRWMLMEENKRIREKNPDSTGTHGHACWSPSSGLLCWIPPTGSG